MTALRDRLNLVELITDEAINSHLSPNSSEADQRQQRERLVAYVRLLREWDSHETKHRTS